MSKSTDVRVKDVALYFLPVPMRVPLKFGHETVTDVVCARVRMTVETAGGRRADGWGETPLSVAWGWPSQLPYAQRSEFFNRFCSDLAQAWRAFSTQGHPMEVGHMFLQHELPECLRTFNHHRCPTGEKMPWLAALISNSAFDIALHDAYGNACGLPVYDTYNGEFMNADCAAYLKPAQEGKSLFHGKYPQDFFVKPAARSLPVWHLVGGKDPISPGELTGSEPDDGYPVLLRDWIRRDGLKCLKIKLRGNDAAWDYDRIVKIGQLGIGLGVDWLTTDFNCTVTEVAYVNEILDQLMAEHPRIYGMILYVEQPFPYDLELHQIDVHSLSARKPLFMDESAHDWRMVRLGRELGWTGVALKTCKTQTGALLTLCWAKAHGMTLMVQDLTNPMLAQVPHCLLAAHAGTIMGVESNSMQFYPEASKPEESVHPGLYRRRNGQLDLSTLSGPGFGYRVPEIGRALPPPQ